MGKIIRVKNKSKTWNLKNFYEERNNILFYRSLGGLGDILMHRMMFEDFKKISPETKLFMACPPQYMDCLIDHPYLDGVLNSQDTFLDDYPMWFNTSNACGKYESSIAPLSDKHRSDIWAEFCGVKLTSHNMHIKMTEDELKKGQELIKKVKNKEGPSIALCPISAIASKNLLPQQIKNIVNELHDMNYFVFGLHGTPIQTLTDMKVPTICGIKTREWMSVIHAADYIISVDTSAFHMAGGIGKPLTGIFTWADGKIYGKYFDFFLVQKHRDNGDWNCGPCYNYGSCPLTKNPIKPCITTINNDMIMEQIINMLKKWPK